MSERSPDMPPTIPVVPDEVDIHSQSRSLRVQDDLFPPELVVKFFEHLHDDKDLPAVKVASLVCRSWRAISSPYVFRRVVVSSKGSLEGLAAFLESDLGIHRYARTLVICPRPGEVPASADWASDVPATLAALLPGLQAVELAQLNEHDTHLGTGFVRGLAAFAAVGTLTLRQCTMTPRLLHALVSAPPALHTVAVQSLLTAQVGVDADVPQLRNPALQSLEVRPTGGYVASADNILPWIATTATAQSLRALKLTVRLVESVGVGRFVQAVAGRLEELELDLEPFLDLPLETLTMKQNISITSCTQLRSFAVYDPDVLSPAVAGFLNELNSQRLETISLRVTAEVTGPALLPDLSSLAVPLSQRLGSLKAVRVGYRGPVAIGEARRQIEASLAPIHAKNILVVHRA
ncbi:hypothetical protein PsYK624_060930 [Phanerochaete sordida]|uniref:F-box domain-containing protein n=1 Tax=Phanerochaete sordida TaxID=48140 RepID=A0A9P3G8Q2_9APHY|nr:hypothetical protein PsYK624_060930 [Phanerochaete sordida]